MSASEVTECGEMLLTEQTGVGRAHGGKAYCRAADLSSTLQTQLVEGEDQVLQIVL